MSLDMSVVTDLGSLLHALSPEQKNEFRKLEKVSLKLCKTDRKSPAKLFQKPCIYGMISWQSTFTGILKILVVSGLYMIMKVPIKVIAWARFQLISVRSALRILPCDMKSA